LELRQWDALSRSDTGGGREICTESWEPGTQPVGAGSHPCPVSLRTPGSSAPPLAVTKRPCRHLRPTPRMLKVRCRYHLVYAPKWLFIPSGRQ